MRKIKIIFCILVLALSVSAQSPINAGLKAGMTTSKLSTNISDYSPQTINNYSFGAFARINFGRLYIQPEAYFNSKGGEYIDQLNIETINSFNLKTVDVPALLGIKLINQKAFNLRILGGPVLSFLTDKSVRGQFNRDELKNSFFGWQYGAGVDFLFLTFDARMESYNNNFLDIPDFDTNNGTFVLSLGVKLF